MCGRFTLHSEPEKVKAQFGLSKVPDLPASYNIAPSQQIPVVYEVPTKTAAHTRAMILMQWGFIPWWAKKEQLTPGIINARVETLDKKPAFKQAIRSKRCLILADGFYEWKSGPIKQPYYIKMKDDSVFGMAGIWDQWQGEKEIINSCAILTVEANESLSPLHARMPAMVEREHYAEWLDPLNHPFEKIKPLLKPYDARSLEITPVSRKVNNVRYNEADCIKPLEV